jgi:ABC-type iron transport system FetAB ATPase subunit
MTVPLLIAENLVVASMPSWQAINLKMVRGDVVLIHVPAACGMTALARTLLGLQPMQAGCVQLMGHNLALLSERQQLPLRLRTAYLPPIEGAGLLPAWTGFDNLALSWIQHAQGKFTSAQNLQAELEAEALSYGIPESWLIQPVALRSRSERQALGLWRLLRSRPEFILLEEWALHARLVNELKLDILLADTLTADPAILILTSDPAYCLPDVIATRAVRQGAIVGGVLQWLSPSSQGPGDV